MYKNFSSTQLDYYFLKMTILRINRLEKSEMIKENNSGIGKEG